MITPEQFERGVYTRLMGHHKKKEKKIAKMKIQVSGFEPYLEGSEVFGSFSLLALTSIELFLAQFL